MRYLYYLLGRLLRPFALLIFFVHNGATHRARTKAVVRSRDGKEVLLIKNWTGTSRWGLPGGGIEKGERAIDALRRELAEELGLELSSSAFDFIATLPTRQYDVETYLAVIDKDDLSEAPHNPWEITHQQWFAIDNLPEVTETAAKALAHLADQG